MWFILALLVIYLSLQLYLHGEWDMTSLQLSLVAVLLWPLVAAQTLYVGLGARSTLKAVAAGLVLLAAGMALFLAGPLEVLALQEEPAWHRDLGGQAYLPLVGLAVAAGILAPRLRWLRNAAVPLLLIGGAIAVGYLVDFGRVLPERQTIEEVRYVGLVLLGACVVAFVLALLVERRRTWLWGVPGMVGFVFAAAWLLEEITPWQAWFFVGLMILVPIVQAARLAGGGVVNRALLALLPAWVLFSAGSALCIEWFGWSSLFWEIAGIPHRYAMGPFVPLAVVSIAAVLSTALFVILAVRQANRLMERNG